MMLRLYHAATTLASPLIPLWLKRRLKQGKEDAQRLHERLGLPSSPRPHGSLLWLHAASVGESGALLPLIHALRKHYPAVQLLLTTGTVTSAQLMANRLPEGVLHHYAPVDTPSAVARFMEHWKPCVGVFVESELWPNLMTRAHAFGCALVLVNARMSVRSYTRWRRLPKLARRLMQMFSIVYACSEADAQRLRALGAVGALSVGNMKYDAPLLPADAAELVKLTEAIHGRPVWLAASTHPGEEEIIARAHRTLRVLMPGVITIIVPRHPLRGAEIMQTLSGLAVARRSAGHVPAADTDVYLADTMGELGLFYRLARIALVGGSLVAHGGQNPFEAARLGCAVLAGPHMENFAEMVSGMETAHALLRVSAESLAAEVAELLQAPEKTAELGLHARRWAEAQGGATQKILEALAPLFQEAFAHAA